MLVSFGDYVTREIYISIFAEFAAQEAHFVKRSHMMEVSICHRFFYLGLLIINGRVNSIWFNVFNKFPCIN